MKIAVVGSRSFPHLDLVKMFVDDLALETTIITGGAMGVDKAAEKAARDRGMELIVIYPGWTAWGKGAGFKRNKLIVDMADEVIAFWDGESHGTKNTIEHARLAKKTVNLVRPRG